MPKKYKPLSWSPSQREIFKLLEQGKTSKEIVGEIGVAYSAITLVKNARDKGETPPPPGFKHISQNDQKPVDVLKEKPAPPDGQKETAEEGPVTVVNDAETAAVMAKEAQEKAALLKAEETSKLTPRVAATGSSAYMKLQPQAIYVPITPIMLNTFDLCVNELHWRKDMPWENFIDTCLVLLTKSWGYIIRGWYKVPEDTETLQQHPPPELPPDGNGGFDEKSAAYQEMVKLVQQMITVAKKV